jgi:hypothetical protein
MRSYGCSCSWRCGRSRGSRCSPKAASGYISLGRSSGATGAAGHGREYKADEYAASLGQAEELADFLEIHALIHDHPVPFI